MAREPIARSRRALVITEGTAANYVQRVLNCLELRTRAQVAAWAAEHLLSDQAQDAKRFAQELRPSGEEQE